MTFLKNKLTLVDDDIKGLQYEVNNLEGTLNILKRENETITLKNEKLVKNTAIARDAK